MGNGDAAAAGAAAPRAMLTIKNMNKSSAMQGVASRFLVFIDNYGSV
jgi:hypothetical protein